MEKEEKFIRSIAGRSFSDEEYRMLRSEQNLRIEMINGHGFSVISFVLVFFSAIFVFVCEILKLACKETSVLGQNIWVDTVIVLAISILCLLPIFLVYCLSAKYEDALRQIVSVGAYCRVFYEFPSMIRDSKENKNILAWEMFHCNSAVPKAKLFTSEYLLISIATAILSFAITLALICCSYIINGFFEDNVLNSVAALCVFIIVYGLSMSFAVYIIIKTRKNTQTDKIMAKYGNSYTEQYLEIAEKSEFLTIEEIEEFKRFKKIMQERDNESVK